MQPLASKKKFQPIKETTPFTKREPLTLES